MNVLMISDVYFPRINGVSTSIETFRRELMMLGVKVFLVAPAYGEHEIETDITRIPSRTVMFDPEDRIMRYASIKALTGSLGKLNLDLVHIQTPFVAHYAGTAIAKTLKLPSVVTYHTFFEEYLYHYIPLVPSSWMQALARRFSRSQCNDVDAVVVPSSAMENKLLSYGVKKPIHRIPTGIPLDKFVRGDGVAFREQHGISLNRPVILYVGRVAFEKNLDFLLRAVAFAKLEVPDLLFVIAGEGPATTMLQQLTFELHIEQNVKFIGYLDRQSSLLDCYSAADAFVFASRTETQGLVLLEAMALGLPVVSTAVMGTQDIVSSAACALVAPDDIEGFAWEIVRILIDTDLRASLAKAAPKCALEWASGMMAEKMLNLYADLVI